MAKTHLYIYFLITIFMANCSYNPTAPTKDTEIGSGAIARSTLFINAAPPQSIGQDTASSPIPITITDSAGPLDCATSISLVSSNNSIINNSGVTYSGIAPNCMAILNSNLGQRGVVNLRFVVTNGTDSISTPEFSVTVRITVAAAITTHDTKVWLDGQDIQGNGATTANGTPITLWYDKSDSDNHMSGTGGATYSSASQAVQFNNTAQPITGTYGLTLLNTHHSFAVITSGPTIDNNVFFEHNTPRIALGRLGILGGQTTLGNNQSFPGGNITGTEVISLEYKTNGEQNSYRNGNIDLSFSQSQSFSLTQNLFIGDDATGGNRSRATDFIHEFIAINNDMTEADRQLVEGALACKWNLQSLLPASHRFKNFCY